MTLQRSVKVGNMKFYLLFWELEKSYLNMPLVIRSMHFGALFLQLHGCL